MKPPLFVQEEPKKHICTICGKKFEWNKDCEWFGHYDLKLDKEVVFGKVCSQDCKIKSRW